MRGMRTWELALMATFSGTAQAHAATTSGHLNWVAHIPWVLGLMAIANRPGSCWSAVKGGLALSALTGMIAGAHLWGIVYYHGAVYVLVIAFHSLVWSIFGCAAVVLLRRCKAAAPLAAGAAWALIENLRSLGGLSFPFFFGGMLADESYIAQSASVIGSAGVSGLLFWYSFAMAGLLATLWNIRTWASRWSWAPAALALVLVCSAGAVRLYHPQPAPTTRRIAAIQGSVPTWLYSIAAGPGPFSAIIEEHYGFLYRKAMSVQPPPDLIVLPETAFGWYLSPTTAAIRRIRPFSAMPLPRKTSVVFGSTFEPHATRVVVNGVAVLRSSERDGLPELAGIVAKRRLVPFIETGYHTATDWSMLRTGSLTSGVMVCYESMYPEAARISASRGADILLVVADDGGLRSSPLAWTHAQQARMRAIESGIPMVRAGQAGISYAADAYGRVLGALGPWETDVIIADVPLHNIKTIYRRLGIHVTWLWAAIVALGAMGRRCKAP